MAVKPYYGELPEGKDITEFFLREGSIFQCVESKLDSKNDGVLDSEAPNMANQTISKNSVKYVPPRAAFKGYFEAAERVMKLFAENRYGRRKIASIVNSEGYRLRDVKGKPKQFDDEAVRAITAIGTVMGVCCCLARQRGAALR